MANNYEVGNILINLETKANKIDKALSGTITSLKALKRSISGISNTNLDKVQENLKVISSLNFEGLGKAFKPLENINMQALSSFNRQMKNISNLNLDNIDFRKLHSQFNSLTRIIDPFIQKIVQAEPSLKAFSNAIDLGRVNAQLSVAEAKVNAINSKSNSQTILDDLKIKKANVQLQISEKRLDKLNQTGKKTKNVFDKAFNWGKIYWFINYTKRLGKTIGSTVTEAINFEETLNKFQVSMGGYYQESLKFVNSITKAFNLSTESIMNYQSTFKNMLSALGGLDNDVSYKLSETLTRMALDYASLFNVSTERAMEQFQAVLSGQIRSIRSVSGYDVSETSLYEIYKGLGGDKSMRQLDQIEKRLLRIIAVQQQMEDTNALGDFAKTINSTANQLKQLKETLKEIGRWIGQLLMSFIEPFVEKVLAGAIAVRELLKSLSISLGYVDKQFGGKSIFGEMKENAEATNEAVETLKRNLLGFDKLNVLGGTNADGTGTDYSLLTDKIKEYATSLDTVKNKANELSTKILEWLGYTYDINGNLEGTGERLHTILGISTGLITSILASKIFTKISALVKTIGSLGGSGGLLAGLVSPIGLIVAAVTAVVAGFVSLYNSSEKFKTSIDKTLSNIKENLKVIWDFMKFAFEKLKPAINFVWEIVKTIGGIVVDIILKAVETITNIFTGDLLSAFKSFVNIFIDAINIIIRALNKINFDFPDWIPGIGGKSFGINIPEIPMLANGGVLDQPTVVMAGEYAGAKQNKEIVTPENLMREVFIESMLPIAQIIASGNNEVVNAIEDLSNRPIELNGRKVSENIYNDLQKVALRKGQLMFANAR